MGLLNIVAIVSTGGDSGHVYAYNPVGEAWGHAPCMSAVPTVIDGC